MSKSKEVAVYQPSRFPAMERSKERTRKRALLLLKEIIDQDAKCRVADISDREVLVALETVLRFAKTGRWVDDWETDFVETLTAYFRGKKS